MNTPHIHAGHLRTARVEVVHIPGDTEPIYRIFLDGPDGEQAVLVGTEFDLVEYLADVLARAIDPLRPAPSGPTPAGLHLAAGEAAAASITRLPHQYSRHGGTS